MENQQKTNFQAALDRPWSALVVTVAATIFVQEVTPIVAKAVGSAYREIKSWFKTGEKKEDAKKY